MDANDKATRIAERDGLCSVSSNTRWQRLIPLIVAFPWEKRIKYIDCDEPTQWQRGLWQPHPRYVDASGGPEGLKFVEWIEIRKCESIRQGGLVHDLVTNHSDGIRKVMESQRAAFRETETSFMILGYTRAANS